MEPLVEYIAGREVTLSRRELNRIIDRYPWFTTARRVRAHLTGEGDPALILPATFRPTVPPVTIAPTASPAPPVITDDALPPELPGQTSTDPTPFLSSQPSAESAPLDLIDRFIEHGGYRIVPTDETHDVEVDVDIDPTMVSAQLAAIYRAQGLVAEAEKIESILKGR